MGRTQLITETAPSPSPLTGRAVRSPHPLVTDCVSIDARDLHADHAFAPGTSNREWIVNWTAPLRPPHRVAYRGVWYGPVLQGLLVATLEPSEKGITRWGDATFIGATQTAPHLGGSRWWLICPRCSRRVRIIYSSWSTREWSCRECMGLTYRSRRFHRDRWYEGIWGLTERLERLKRDLWSRSWKRRLRARAALDPTGALGELLRFVQ